MKIVLALTVTAGLMAASFSPHLGMTPILGALVCAACFLRRRDVLLAGLGAMMLRELVVGVSVFTAVRLLAVGSVIGLLWLVRVKPAWRPLLTGVILAAPTYHLILVVGDWVTQFCTKEPRTTQGLFTTLMSGLPYIQRSFLTDVVFTAAFFGLYTLGGSVISAWRPALLPSRTSS